jgi:tryptophanyl-tRNA synthetase
VNSVTDTVVSGIRPTGRLHFGNYFGALKTWIELQEEYECYFFVADWHALTTSYDETEEINKNTFDLVRDCLAAGLDPDQCTIFRQSEVPEHAELHLMLEMITPEGWLKRNPTYKEAQQELGEKRTRHVGFLSYPVLQTADVLAYEGTKVPVGEDQKPHLEIGRRIVRRFNDLYDADLPEMEALIKDTPKLLGLDGRKMSKSYGNCIYLSDSPEERKNKIMSAETDMGSDPGDQVPEEGPVANLFLMMELFDAGDLAEEYREEYRDGEIQYGYMKQDLAEAINEYFSEMDERRSYYDNNPDEIHDVLEQGRSDAKDVASDTLKTVRNAMGLIDS